MHLFPSMWAYGHHFRIEYVDDRHITQHCGVEVVFVHSSRASHRDQNLIEGKLRYIGNIQEILQVDFSLFQCVIFHCKWWDSFDQRNVKEDRDSGLICINSKRNWVESKEPYVFPKRCNKVSFYLDVLDGDWWYVLRHDLRSKYLFENNNVTIPSKGDNQGNDNFFYTN
jgi:hypothetical protein